MPRRIPDYPDVYYIWNFISSVGSIFTFLGVLVFFYLIVDAFYQITWFWERINIFNSICLSFSKTSKEINIDEIESNKINNILEIWLLEKIVKIVDSYLTKKILINELNREKFKKIFEVDNREINLIYLV